MSAMFARRLLLTASTLTLCLISGTAWSAESVDATSPAEPEQADEIIVTAQRVESTSQKTPISIDVISARQLETQRIVNLQDLAYKSPGLAIGGWSTNPNTLQVYIRGAGLFDNQASTDPAVGINIDGVYLGRSAGLTFEMPDLQRIEVLRGPQGTLYGRNTSGGVINIITRRPDLDDFSATLSGEIGNYDAHKVSGSINAPLVQDVLAVSVTGVVNRRNGWIKNLGAGDDWNGVDRWAVRGNIRWRPVESLMIDYIGDYSRDASSIAFTAGGGAGPTGFQAIALPGSYFERPRAGQTAVRAMHNDMRSYGHNLTMTWEALDNLTIKSVTGYRNLSSTDPTQLQGGLTAPPSAPFGTPVFLDNRSVRLPGLPAAIIPLPAGFPDSSVGNTFVDSNRQHQWSQEFNFIGNFGDRLNYVAGLYWFQEKGSQSFFGAAVPGYVVSILGAIPGQSGGTVLVPTAPSRFFNYKYESIAAFAQINYNPPILDDKLTVSLGGRLTQDKRFLFCQSCGLLFQAGFLPAGQLDQRFSAGGNLKYSRFNPSATLNYAASDDLNLYAKFAQGYRSGGFNVRAVSQDRITYTVPTTGQNVEVRGFSDGFGSEKVNSYEVGLKGKFFDNLLSTEIAAFYQKTDGAILPIRLPGTSSSFSYENAGSFIAKGVELNGVLRLARDLRVTFAYTYLDTKYQNIRDLLGNDVTANFTPIQAPQNQGNVAVDYRLVDTPIGTLEFNLNYAWTDKVRKSTTAADELLTTIPSVGILNASVAASLGERTRVTVWVKNLTDKEYISNVFNGNSQLNAVAGRQASEQQVYWGEPRMYGLTFTHTFGKQ